MLNTVRDEHIILETNKMGIYKYYKRLRENVKETSGSERRGGLYHRS